MVFGFFCAIKLVGRAAGLRRVLVPSGDGALLEVKVKMCAWRRRRSSQDSPAFLSVHGVCVLLQG